MNRIYIDFEAELYLELINRFPRGERVSFQALSDQVRVATIKVMGGGIQQITSGSVSRTKPSNYPGTDQYRVRVGVRNQDPECLEISLQKTFNQKDWIAMEFNLTYPSIGPFQSLCLRFDKRLERFKAGILELAQRLCYIANSQYQIYVWEALTKSQPACVEELYRSVRHLPGCRIGDKIWLFLIVDGKGFYLLDQVAKRAIFEKTIKPSEKLPKLVPEVIDDFQLAMNEEQLFSTEAFSQQRIIVDSFNNARYKETGVQRSEEYIYGARNFAALPLFGWSNLKIALAAPAKFQEHIEKGGSTAKRLFLQKINEMQPAIREELKALGKNWNSDSPLAGEKQEHNTRMETLETLGAAAGTFTREFLIHLAIPH
jgi:hypothetical protein